jgi:hypothetical protein
MTLAIHGDSIDSYCQTVQGSVLNIHLFFFTNKISFKMKRDLKSLLLEENIEVLVADDMSVIKGGTHCGHSGGGHGHGKGRSGSKRHGGWGGCIPPRPRPCPPPPPCPRPWKRC